jgi:hypothetical protein
LRLGVAPNPEAELEGRPTAIGALLWRRIVAATHERRADGNARSRETSGAGEQAYARAGGHVPSLAAGLAESGFELLHFVK